MSERRPEVLDGFVFLTGGATDPRSAELLARRPNLYVEKPFSPLALRKFVADLVEARRG